MSSRAMSSRTMRVVMSAAVVVAGTLFFAIGKLGAQSAQAGAEAKTAEQAFKNIQALKGTPADQMIPSMQFISNSLGVECEFCHVEGAFEKDDKKEKETARQMIKMQFAINKENFNGQTEVTCNTCHRGSHSPVGTPIISDEEPKHDAAKPAASLPTADQVLDKFVQAAGGADALQKVTTRSGKGNIKVGGRELSIEVLSKAPDKRVSITHTPNGDNVTAFDGHSGWLGNPGGRPPRDMNAAEAEGARFDAAFNLPLELKKMFDQFRVRSADKIADHEVVQLIGIKQGHPPVRLFFDQQSGLLVRSIRYAETPLGRNPVQLDYADYRDQNGVKVPFRWTLARPLGRFTIQLDQVQQNLPIDDAKFEKPAAAPPSSK